MCDCYVTKCSGCRCEISIHVADFCTARENVHPYCPDCTKKLTIEDILNYQRVFMDEGILDDGCWCMDMEEIKDPVRGKVFFLCTDPDAYGIHLN